MKRDTALSVQDDGDPAVAGRWDRLLAWLTQGAIVSVLMVMPLAMGGRHLWGRLLFLVLVTSGLVAEFLRRAERPSLRCRVPWLPVWMFGAAAMLGALQITAFPTSWIARCTPALHSWFSEAMTQQWQPHATWQTISLSPADSRYTLTLLVAYLGWSWLVIRQLERGLLPHRLIGWVGCAAIGLAGLGLLQFTFNNGRFLWWYDHPSRTTWYVAKGPFANENHFAHAMLVGGWALAWWLSENARQRSEHRSGPATWRSVARWRPVIGWAGMTLIVSSIALARSRAGLALLMLTVLGTLTVVAARCCTKKWQRAGRLPDGFRRRRQWAAFALLGLAALSLGMAFEQNTGRQSRLSPPRLLGEARWALWQAGWNLLPSASWLGTGGGTHRYLYRQSFRGPLDVEFVYAENGYLQIALEYGVAGLSILFGGLAVALFPRRRQVSNGETAAADGGSSEWRSGWHPRKLAGIVLGVVVLHGAVDFVWWIPACLAPAIAVWLAATAWEQRGDAGLPASNGRTAWTMWSQPCWRTILTAVFVVLGGWAVVRLLPAAAAAPAWERYLRYERDTPAAELASEASLNRRIGMLEQVLSDNPGHARASAWLAELLLARFDQGRSQRANAMSLSDLRRAAIGAHFADRDAVVTWLRKAVGEDTSLLLRAEALCERTLQHQLVEWRLYAVAAQLSFLRPKQRGREEWLWQRAEQFAPRDAELLYLLGEEALARGEAKRAWRYWRRASVESAEMALLLQRTIVPKIGVDGYVRAMRPSTEQVRRLYRLCHREFPQQAEPASRWLVAYVKRDLRRPRVIDERLLADAGDAARRIGAWDDVRLLAEYRLQRDPTDVVARRKLAEAEIRLGHSAAARRAIQWLERFGADRDTSQRLWEQWRTMAPSPTVGVVDRRVEAGVDRDGK